jgi:hypothetical protein
MEETLATFKRPKHHLDRLPIKCEQEEAEVFPNHTQPTWASTDSESVVIRQRQRSIPATPVDSDQHELPTVAVLGVGSVTPSGNIDHADNVAPNIEDGEIDTPATHNPEETIQETRDKLMHRLRTAVSSEDLDSALSTVESHHTRTRDRFLSASTAGDKLGVIRAYRAWTFVVSVQQLHRREYVYYSWEA